MLMSILSSSVLAGIVGSKLAYLDPGSGSYLIQLLIATLLGGAFVIKAFWRQILGIFGIKAKQKDLPVENGLVEDQAKLKIYENIYKICSVNGKLNIKDFVTKNFVQIKDGYPTLTTEEGAVEVVKSIIEDAIVNQKLKGLIEAGTFEYVDRDLLTKKTKNININVNMNFNELAQKLEKKGVSVTSIQCATCGNALEIADIDSNFIKCQSCGNTNHVVDIYNKYSQILNG